MHVHGLRVVVVVLHVVDSGHVRVRGVRGGGADVGSRHAPQRDARREVVQQVALQALCRLVVRRVVVRGEHGRVVQVRRRGGGGAGHAGHGRHGVIGGVRLERVALLRHDVHGGQSLGSLQQRLIEAREDVSLKLQQSRGRRSEEQTDGTKL